MTKVETKDRTPTNDKGTRLVMMERCGGGRPMDPCRDTIAAELRIKGEEVIPVQSRSYENIHPSRVPETAKIMPNPIRSYALEVREESYDMIRQRI